MEITDKHWDLVAHSLGIDIYNAKKGRGYKNRILPQTFYRNYFASSEGGSDYTMLKELEELGITESWLQYEKTFFGVTEKGIDLFKSYFNSVVTSVLDRPTKAQLRYEDYLDADTGMSYDEYMGIELPKIINKDGVGWQYISTKYNGVSGQFKATKKEAKLSYKEALKNYKYLIKN